MGRVQASVKLGARIEETQSVLKSAIEGSQVQRRREERRKEFLVNVLADN